MSDGKDIGNPPGDSASATEAQATAIKEDIDRTRSQIGDTLTAIEQKLEPGRLREQALGGLDVVEDRVKVAVKEQVQETKAVIKRELIEAKDSVKKEVQEALGRARESLRAATIGKVENMARLANERTVEVRDSLLETMWSNPLPTALAGVGLVWLYMNRRAAAPRYGEYYEGSEWRRPANGPIAGAREQASGALHGAREAAGRAADQVRSKASDLADAASQTTERASRAAAQIGHDTAEAAGRLAHRVSEGASHIASEAGDVTSELAHRAGRQFRRVDDAAREAMRDNPLGVAAACLAAGALVGLALPRTRKEDELLGEARDRLMDRARDLAHEGVTRAQHVAHGLGEIRSATEPKSESTRAGT